MEKVTVVVVMFGIVGVVSGYGGHHYIYRPRTTTTTTTTTHSQTEETIYIEGATGTVPTITETPTVPQPDWRDPRDPDGDSIVGLAGYDYPILSSIPRTDFNCSLVDGNQVPGYYADNSAQCQVFHVCLESGEKVSFLCPNGTMFNQLYSVCDWWYNVKCGEGGDETTLSALVVTNATLSTADDGNQTTTTIVTPIVQLQIKGITSQFPNNGNINNFVRRPFYSQGHF